MANADGCETTSPHKLGKDLLNIYDEMTEFNDCCAFLCDAFASQAAEEGALDTSTIEGLRCLSQWMKDRMNHIKEQLGAIQKGAHAAERAGGCGGS